MKWKESKCIEKPLHSRSGSVSQHDKDSVTPIRLNMNARTLFRIFDWSPHRPGLLAIAAGLTLALAQPFSASGTATALASLDLTGFSVTPASGSIVWSGPWTLSTFVSVNNSDGDVDFQFQTDSASASASASVPYASAHSSANVPAAGGRFGHVEAAVNLPAGIDAAATVLASQSTFENFFTIMGASGFVDVSFSAVLASILTVMTDASGTLAYSDAIFNLNVDGAPVLSFFDQVSVGPNGLASSSMNPTLTGTISLDSSIEHYFSMRLDTDPTGTTVPEQGETCLLLLLGLSALALVGNPFGQAKTTKQDA